jgi:hypothetical protein
MKRITGKRALSLLIMFVLVGAIIYLGVTYFQDYRQEGTLEDEIAEKECEMAALPHFGDIGALEAELASLEDQLDDVYFPRDVDSTLIFDLIRASASTAEIEDYSFSEFSTTQTAVNGGAHEYQLHSFEVTAVGTLDELFEFIGEVEGDMPYDAVQMQDMELIYDTATEIWEITFEILVFAQSS